MRPLTSPELLAVSGGETDLIVTIPPGVGFTTRLEANQTTTIEFTWATGVKESWNSGQAITCFILTSGFSLLGGVAGPAGNLLLGLLAKGGCDYIFQEYTDDGDGM